MKLLQSRYQEIVRVVGEKSILSSVEGKSISLPKCAIRPLLSWGEWGTQWICEEWKGEKETVGGGGGSTKRQKGSGKG